MKINIFYDDVYGIGKPVPISPVNPDRGMLVAALSRSTKVVAGDSSHLRCPRRRWLIFHLLLPRDLLSRHFPPEHHLRLCFTIPSNNWLANNANQCRRRQREPRDARPSRSFISGATRTASARHLRSLPLVRVRRPKLRPVGDCFLFLLCFTVLCVDAQLWLWILVFMQVKMWCVCVVTEELARRWICWVNQRLTDDGLLVSWYLIMVILCRWRMTLGLEDGLRWGVLTGKRSVVVVMEERFCE